MSISLADQIACVEREIAMRRREYPSLVSSGHWTQADADKEIKCMEAVADTLVNLSELLETAYETHSGLGRLLEVVQP